jgi:hypothetical protein
MPPSVRVSIIVLSVLAGMLLLYSGLTWFGREAIIDRLVEDGSIARADGMRFIVIQLVPFAVLGLLLAASAWFVPRRRPWARWLGVAAGSVLTLLTLISILFGGVVSVLSLLLLVLSIAAVTSLLSRHTTTWVTERREGA